MRSRRLIIWLIVLLSLILIFYINRWLQRVMRPRESAGRLFLFFFVNFLLVIIYTLLMVGLIVRVFPLRG